MKSFSLIAVVVILGCIEFSEQRNLWRKDASDGQQQQQHVIVKRDLGDDFFGKLLEKGKSLFSDDDENDSNSNKRDSEVTISHDNNDRRDGNSNSENSHTNSNSENSRTDSNTNSENSHTNSNTNSDHSNTHANSDTDNTHSHSATSTNSDDDDLIDSETLKNILQKVIAYASSTDSDSDNQQSNDHTSDSEHKGENSDSDAMMDKLGSILIREGLKIGIAELASSAFGKK